METLYTVRDVAEYLKLKEDTVNKYIQRGKLKAIKIQGALRIKESDLIKLVEGK